MNDLGTLADLPADTMRSHGFPPLVPDNHVVRDDAEHVAWAERTLAWAATVREPASRATRKPRLKPRSSGRCVYRNAQRALSAP